MNKIVAVFLSISLLVSTLPPKVFGQPEFSSLQEATVLDREALMPSLLFPGISYTRRQAVERIRELFPSLIFFRAGEIARKHGIRLFWFSGSSIQLDALDEVLQRLTPEAKKALPPIVVWPGLIMPYTGLWATAFPNIGSGSAITIPTLLSAQGFSWLLGHLIAQNLISRSRIILSFSERLDLEAYLSGRLAEDIPLKGPLDDEFQILAYRWLEGPAPRVTSQSFDPIYDRPQAFRWGGVIVYGLSVLALAGWIGPLLVGIVFTLPFAAVILVEAWVRLGLQSSFQKIQVAASTNRIQRSFYRVPYVFTRAVAVILLLVQSVYVARYPDFSQILEPFRQTVGQIKKVFDAIQSDADDVVPPAFTVTPLVTKLPGNRLTSPTVGELTSQSPRDWTEIYTFYFDNTIDEKTREYSNPMTGASDPFEAINGLSTTKQVIARASDLVGLHGVTWQLMDVEDPSLFLGFAVQLTFADNRVFSWRAMHRVSGPHDIFFAAAPDQAKLQAVLRANGSSNVRVTLTAYSGTTAGNPSLSLKKKIQKYPGPPASVVSWRLARFQLKSITLETPTPRQIQDRTPAPGVNRPPSTTHPQKQNASPLSEAA